MGVAATLLHFVLRGLVSSPAHHDHGAARSYELVHEASASVHGEEEGHATHQPTSGRKQVALAVLVVAALSARMVTLPELISYTQCTVLGVEVSYVNWCHALSNADLVPRSLAGVRDSTPQREAVVRGRPVQTT